MIDKLQELCNAKNITFTYLERELGLGKSSIRRWDTNAPSIDKVQKVADYFNCTVDYLLGRTDEPLEIMLPDKYNIDGQSVIMGLVDAGIAKGLTETDFEDMAKIAKILYENKKNEKK